WLQPEDLGDWQDNNSGEWLASLHEPEQQERDKQLEAESSGRVWDYIRNRDEGVTERLENDFCLAEQCGSLAAEPGVDPATWSPLIHNGFKTRIVADKMAQMGMTSLATLYAPRA